MKISEEKKEKISEQILAYLYSVNPKPIFTLHIAREIARDEEFIKKILIGLKNKNFVIEIKKNPKGVHYRKRSRWKLTEEIYKIYRLKQINL